MFLGPVDAKVALLNGSVDAWATWEPYTTQMVKTNEGQILRAAKGCCRGIPSSRQRIPRLMIRINAPRCRIISSAWPAPSAGPTPISTATAKRWGDHPLPGGDRPRAVCQPPVAVAAAGRGNSGPAAGNGGLYLANGLIRTRLDVKPTFDRRFSVPAAEVTP